METVAARVTWGTWEELLLGGAVIRHGVQDWNTVAGELRAQALCPYNFTAEVCKAKYDELQERYSGCEAWFEELRKKRMDELRHALELSEGSIGSLESKLETLKAEKGGESCVNYASSQTESPAASQKSGGLESFSKETSKNGLSAGSFTLETRTSCSAECLNPHAVSGEETQTKPEVLRPFEQGRVLISESLLDSVHERKGGMLKKRRGKRKRRDCSSKEVKESSVGESGFLDSADVVTASRSKENSTSDCAEVSRSTILDDQVRLAKKDGIDDLLNVFNSVVDHKCASTFRHRLDSQKRGRYKKMIRKHMDFDTLRSRITSSSIVSVKELFRDLLLLANNALVFYSKNTREYKSALLLRELTTSTLRQHCNGFSSSKAASTKLSAMATPTTTICSPPVKPQNVHPGEKNVSLKRTEAKDVAKTPKKGFGQPRRVGCKINTKQQSDSPVRGRKGGKTR